MYHHLIMSRKEQSNKKKLSPLTNHKNTKNGTIKGSFDRVNLFKQAAAEEEEEEEEEGKKEEPAIVEEPVVETVVKEEEDKLFNYNRQSIQNLLITTFNEKWFCNRIT